MSYIGNYVVHQYQVSDENTSGQTEIANIEKPVTENNYLTPNLLGRHLFYTAGKPCTGELKWTEPR